MVEEWCRDGQEGIDKKDAFLYIIDLPNPHDPEGAWIEVGRFNSLNEMLDYARKTFGADDNGKIDICSICPEGE